MIEQEKREKVIKALECRLDINGSKYKHCLSCDYRHDIDHCQWACQTDGILEDALALLKVQEPQMVEERTYNSYTKTINCPKCGQRFGRVGHDNSINLYIDEDPNYCWHCGQAVKWDD